MSDFIKQNGGPLVIGAIFFAVIAGYIEMRIPPIVDAKFVEAGVVSTDKIDAMDDDIEDNKDDISGLTTRWNKLVDAIAEK